MTAVGLFEMRTARRIELGFKLRPDAPPVVVPKGTRVAVLDVSGGWPYVQFPDGLKALLAPDALTAVQPERYVYSWGNNAKRVELRGRHCKIVASGRLGSALVEFDDGQREIVSRCALRRASVYSSVRAPVIYSRARG